ncbi:MAG: hypothetical protein D6762_00475 [Candidatus Neomarinimicrobiota bacterium]|nr:MAG: hypothetical protein D6762_00475 [Candidatus Neomarinimicrobiota bacterium]
MEGGGYFLQMFSRQTILILTLLTGMLTGQRLESMEGAVGSVTLDGKIWNSLAFRPVIPIGKAALALDVVVYVDDEGNVHRDEWDFSTPEAAKNTLLDKIYYFRWGQPADPLYFKIGALDRVTLGYGILVSRYTNTLYYPDVRRVGVDLGIKWGPWHLTGFANDLKEYASFAGLRLETARWTGFPVGLSAVMDRNQYLALEDRDGDGRPDYVDDFPDDSHSWVDTDGDGLPDNDPLEWDIDGDGITDTLNGNIPGWTLDTTVVLDPEVYRKPEPLNIHGKSDPVGAVALDVGLPLFQEKNLTLFVYAQAAKLIGTTRNPETGESVSLGSGLVPLGLGGKAGPVTLRAEYRLIPHGNFEFGYWSRSYDAERAVFSLQGNEKIVLTKESRLGKYGALKGLNVSAGVNVLSLIGADASYQHLVGETWDEASNSFRTDRVESFLATLTLKKKISKLNTARMFYQQQNVPNPFRFRFTENTVMGYELGLEMSGGMVLSYVFTRTFIDLNGDGDVEDIHETVNRTVFETSFRF